MNLKRVEVYIEFGIVGQKYHREIATIRESEFVEIPEIGDLICSKNGMLWEVTRRIHKGLHMSGEWMAVIVKPVRSLCLDDVEKGWISSEYHPEEDLEVEVLNQESIERGLWRRGVNWVRPDGHQLNNVRSWRYLKEEEESKPQ